jgi:hypothetical protein
MWIHALLNLNLLDHINVKLKHKRISLTAPFGMKNSFDMKSKVWRKNSHKFFPLILHQFHRKSYKPTITATALPLSLLVFAISY